MKIGVFGIGYVGLTAAACLSKIGHNVICCDKNACRVNQLLNGDVPIYEPQLKEIVETQLKKRLLHFTTSARQTVENSDIIYITVGTPSSKDGSADMHDVLQVARNIGEHADRYKIVVTKSTVPVGAHRQIIHEIATSCNWTFDYVSNPEFLREGSAVYDYLHPDRVILGVINPEVVRVFRDLYAPVLRSENDLIVMNPASAELSKYAANCMLAARISAINELSTLCEWVGADIESVRIGIGSDSRIGPEFLKASIGYGGSCFNKDIRALLRTADETGCPLGIFKSTENANNRQIDHFVQKIRNHFASYSGQVVLAVWGLAFKSGTDDTRHSPAIACIEKLLKYNFRIRAYDPKAMISAKLVLNGTVDYHEVQYEPLKGADGLIILTDWKQFRVPDFDLISQNLKNPIIFDGRNIYDPHEMARLGFKYFCIGRGGFDDLSEHGRLGNRSAAPAAI